MKQAVELEFYDESDKTWKRAGDFQQDRDLERRTQTRLVIHSNAADRHE